MKLRSHSQTHLGKSLGMRQQNQGTIKAIHVADYTHANLWKCTCAIQHTHMHNIYTHTYIHTYIHTFIHTYIHAYIHTYIHTHIHTHTHTYIHSCNIHSCIHTYTHTYIHTYIHTHTHMHWYILHTLRYVVIWKKVQSTWYLYIDIFNSNTPPSKWGGGGEAVKCEPYVSLDLCVFILEVFLTLLVPTHFIVAVLCWHVVAYIGFSFIWFIPGRGNVDACKGYIHTSVHPLHFIEILAIFRNTRFS